MKTRNGFVSNSSSSSFIIKNQTNEEKTIYDFAKETSYLVYDYIDYYNWYNDTIEDYINSAKEYEEYTWKPYEEIECVFGDEHGTVMGRVLDYMLRDSDSTKSFSWYFNKGMR